MNNHSKKKKKTVVGECRVEVRCAKKNRDIVTGNKQRKDGNGRSFKRVLHRRPRQKVDCPCWMDQKVVTIW